MNIGDQRNDNYVSHSYFSEGPAHLNKKVKGMHVMFAALAVVAMIIACGCAGQRGQHEGEQLGLWEQTCYDCVKCQDDKLEIISVTYGDKIVTTDLIARYNVGERTFPAGDKTWGQTWAGVKKTLVFTYKLCDKFFTKIIEEGQALVLP